MAGGEPVNTGEVGANEPVYHVELRQFPHSFCRFNLGERELLATIVEPWAREQWIDLGERKWSPHQAKLTVIEGQRIPVQQLSMGRGWRAAQRDGREVTEAMLAFVAQRLATGETAIGGAVPPDTTTGPMAADSLGLEILAGLTAEQTPLRRAWELASARYPQSGAGECLALAERAVASLLRARLIALTGNAGEHNESGEALDEEQATSALRTIDSWSSASERDRRGCGGVSMRRL